ncbi:MAG TPA: GNAT family N-acetyltransferase, partial [Solirubrobacteraceae bacterium]|nr:GNAT family N-acetyltransferase [Solirubrobacteraceae bacterium]
MDTTMPAGHVLRAPTAADAGVVAELLHARDRADLGRPEATVADVRAEWEMPGVELERDAWLVEDERGALVAYALVTGPDLLVAIHPDATGRGLGTELRLAAERRARSRGTRVVRQFVPTANTAARILLLEAGWWPVHHYFRMQIALKDAPPPP